MRRHRRSAFSLVEVTLALGIAAFCLVSLLGLVPIGLNSNRNAVQQTAAASIAASVAADIRNQADIAALSPTVLAVSKTPRYGFDLAGARGTPHTVYVSDDGFATPVDTGILGNSVYRVTLALLSPAGRQPQESTPVRIMVTWPAGAGGSTPNSWPKVVNAGGAFEITIAVDLAR